MAAHDSSSNAVATPPHQPPSSTPLTSSATSNQYRPTTASAAQASHNAGPSSHARHYQAFQLGLSRVPSEAGGIVLNLAAIASLLTSIADLYLALTPVSTAGSWLCIALSCCILAAFVLQAIFHHAHLRAELMKPNKCGSLAALCMSCTFCSSYIRFAPAGERAAYVIVHIASALQLAMLTWFLVLSLRTRSPPAPYWFPATVGIGAAAIAGSKVAMHPDLQLFFFSLAAALCFIVWPWVTCRLASSDSASPAPSVFIHAAPLPVVALAYIQVFVAPTQENLSQSAIAAGHFFFAATSMAALTTLLFAYRRRAFLRRFVLPRDVAYVSHP